MDAQQLSSVGEIVLRRFGKTDFSQRPAEQYSSAHLEHAVRVALGNQGAALFIGADSATATALAASMFDKKNSELQDADRIDALSELGNILAGKLERELGSTRCLGIPKYIPASANPALWQSLNIEAEIWSSFARYAIYIAVIADERSTPLQ